MAQHDGIIANATGAAVRSDINNALAAILSNSSGSTEPSTTYAFQWWYDTTNNLLKLRNSANTAWITLPFDPVNGGSQHGDNVKATFGASDDLQIYHDGSNSYIQDAGTGNLLIRGANVEITTAIGTKYFEGAANIAKLYHTGNQKLATTSTGIDVTGTVTADKAAVYSGVLSEQSQIRFGYSSDYHWSVGRENATTGDLFIESSTTGTDTTRLKVGNGGDISFYEDTGTTAKFFWDASAESLGIGTTSPTYKLTTSASDYTNGLACYNTNAAQPVVFRQNDDGTCQISNFDNAPMTFVTNAVERMRIDSIGNLLVGRTSNYGGAFVQIGESASGNTKPRLYIVGYRNSSFYGEGIKFLAGSDIDAVACNFHNSSGTAVGSIITSASATSYNTSSDYRLKTDVQPMTGATERLKALKPVNFEWISSGERVDGFLAHEAQEVVPEAVTGTKDAVDAEGNPEYQGIDQSKLVPLLVATIQELEARITQLENS